MDDSIEQFNQAESGSLTVEQAIANLRHEDLSLRYYAAWWLGKFRVRNDSAIEALIAALDDEESRTELGGYPLRRNAARALGKLGDRRAVPGLIRCLACEDFYVREAAAQSLEALGDPACIPVLINLLSGGIEAARMVPGRPHLTEPVEAIVEALGTLHAVEAIELVRPFVNHSMPRVQYAALRAMYQLTEDPQYAEQLAQALQSGEVQLRRTVVSDLGAIGYVPAAEAIATSETENSFKLIALKGLLERQLQLDADPTSHRAIEVMTLMDNLL